MKGPFFKALYWALPFHAPWIRFRFLNRPHRTYKLSRQFRFPPMSDSSIRHGKRCFTSSRKVNSALDAESTIYALSTAPGRAAIAVVRVSGPACVQVSQIPPIYPFLGDSNEFILYSYGPDIPQPLSQSTSSETARCGSPYSVQPNTAPVR